MRPSGQIILAVDQGTTNTKVVAIDENGRTLSQAERPLATMAAQPGWVEQDPQAMFANVVGAANEVLQKAGVRAVDVAGLGIANQTETIVVWDRRTGKPAMPAMVWQCRRGAAEIAHLTGSADMVRARTGLDLDPTFSAAKLRWLFTNRPDIALGLREGDLLFGTVDTWLVWKLTGGASHVTEPGNASRTMLFDIDRLAWDDDLFSLFELPIAVRPECRRSNAGFGFTDPSLFGGAIAITGLMGDQQASLLGHGCLRETEAKVTYGTGAFLWINAGAAPRQSVPQGIIRTLAWHVDEPCYAFEGFVIYAGRILDWLAQHLSVSGGVPALVAEAERAGASEGVRLVPAFQGLGSPWWAPDVRAAILGLSEATSTGHIAHAGLEAVCFQIRAISDSIAASSGLGMASLKVDGGMTRSACFLQLQADILGLPLRPSASGAATPFGAALMAGLGAGVWGSLDELSGLFQHGEAIAPRGQPKGRLDEDYRDWRHFIDLLVAGEARRAS
ncbi:MAG: glycerol kinase [Mesorhizobium sp.]|uniref:FGGY family carbohydrate kinase n=1 Tax=Mesorhizobium sp. TaxID=1871066 RepID=UPI001ACD67C8|nr:FGGY family carbohydrate kinase [Mesorhizobium sp.]MBN9216918.1 glycerol kinase [Mesorhizobium sp.]